MTPTAAAVPDMVSFLEQINTSFGTCYAAIDLKNAFLFHPCPLAHQKESADKTNNILPLSYLRISQPPGISHNLDHRDLNHLSFPQDITLDLCFDDIMLIGPNEQRVALTVDLLVRYIFQTVGHKSNKNLWMIYLL